MNMFSNNFEQQYQNGNASSNKNTFKYIIGIVIVLICCIFLILIINNFFRKENYSNSGDTVTIGEKLKIKELDGKFNFSIEVLSSVEKNILLKMVFLLRMSMMLMQ